MHVSALTKFHHIPDIIYICILADKIVEIHFDVHMVAYESHMNIMVPSQFLDSNCHIICHHSPLENDTHRRNFLCTYMAVHPHVM
jgi:hypothetical protein